ncbi:hypothetical protein ACFO1B_40830 [Dactylosporangium siamense]|uniref:Uncharacterized protein n=1 Tax=Dactylosporangium siamense TaxID=685454 RepID=A0A919PFU5_9ACTN|nr:hypothetical protein [Dactylosporangium siamense]GIG42602.1 hypothetical protein Dsi01nite_006430 [Dactylosporangium siamense]
MNTVLRARVLGTAVLTALPLALLPALPVHAGPGSGTVESDAALAARWRVSPVFSLDGDGVRAKGILSGGNDSTLMLFQDWADVIRLYNAYPRTA